MSKTDIKNKVADLLQQMTLEEKASLLSGADGWNTKPVERLGIPSISMADGPHGLRKQTSSNDLGLGNSYPSTCFPTASLLACSWDVELAETQGKAIGVEAQSLGLNIVLGPGVNIKRSPLCGRNFEYFSEDPYLTAKMAGGVINGIQDTGVSACIKHFAANNQETDRFTIDALIEERPLREIYLASFEDTIKTSKPGSVMCSYNKINGQYSSQNKWLLSDVLRDEWGFEGIVMSDWGAVDNRPQGVWAGLELEMPSSHGVNDAEIIKAVKRENVSHPPSDNAFDNVLTIEEIDKAATRMLEFVFERYEKLTNKPCDFNKHHQTAREVARECMVLLENNGILPLKKNIKIGLIGEMAENPRYQGSGSSCVNPVTVSKPIDSFIEYAEINYSQGYSLSDENDLSYLENAVRLAEKEDIVVIIAGLPDHFESEGYDRKHMKMPENQIKLIDEVCKANKNTIVVLCCGSPVEMPFKNNCAAILLAYLGGEAGSDAVCDILFGNSSPCGKLAETFPEKLEHNPSYINFPGDGKTVTYGEGLFVGYRWYDKTRIKPLYPFGYGLSYTCFEYSDIKLSNEKINAEDNSTVTCTVKNTGKLDGKEIVQLYIKEKEPTIPRPEKELKGFIKLDLKAGESKTISFTLDKRSFAYWDTDIKDWYVNSGCFEILIGASSEDIRVSAYIDVVNPKQKPNKLTMLSTVYDLAAHPNGRALLNEICLYFGVDISNMDDVEPVNFTEFGWSLLRNLITMNGFKMTIADLKEKIDKVNECS